MTDAQAHALRILRDHGPLMPSEFARRAWPDSPGWRKMHKVGHGATRGGGMPSAAGGVLGKLTKTGWVGWTYLHDRGEYTITDAGRQALADHDAQRC